METVELKESVRLFDRDGTMAPAGFSRKPNWIYNRENMKQMHIRIKEWDYYLVMTDAFGVAFTISDLGYIRMASVSFLDFEESKDVTRTILKPPALGYQMPSSSEQGVVEWKSADLLLRYEAAPNGRHIYCEFRKFYKNSDFKADLWFTDLPEESMNILIPYDDGKHFYLNQKMNCMPCSGKVVFNWHVYHFDPSRDSGVLDWGRGFWPFDTIWYWATASSMVQGKPFGLNLGYGFGNTEAATENIIYYDGRIHKLDHVSFLIPEDRMSPWTITSDNGRIEAIFQPDLDRAAMINVGPVSSNQHQYFGLLNGTAILDDGTVVPIEQLRMAIEVVHNRY